MQRRKNRLPSQKAREAARDAAEVAKVAARPIKKERRGATARPVKKERQRAPVVMQRAPARAKPAKARATPVAAPKKAPPATDNSLPPALERALAKQKRLYDDVVRKMEDRMMVMQRMAAERAAADKQADDDEVRVLTAKQVAVLVKECGKLSPDEAATALLYMPDAKYDESSGAYEVDLTAMSDRARWRLWCFVMNAAPHARAERLALLHKEREAEARKRVASAQDFASNAYSLAFQGAAFKTQDGRTGTVFYDRHSKTLKVSVASTGETWQLYTENELRAGVLRARGVDAHSDSDSDSDSDLSSSDDECV